MDILIDNVSTDMQFQPGDVVMIDLEAAQREGNTGPCPACGKSYSAFDSEMIPLLRYIAEGTWRVAREQSDLVSCQFCNMTWHDPMDGISVESEVPIEVTNRFRAQSRWFIPRAWLRRVEVP